MPHREPARPAAAPPLRLRRLGATTLVLGGLTIAASLAHQVPASSSPTTTATTAHARPRAAGLDPALRLALRRATADAAADGVELVVTSGRRTRAHQARLFREAVVKYGSEQEAARWVAPPSTSAHVSGDAVDMGPSAALAWLSAHGAAYGLCPVYANEPWHYELRAQAPDHGCPPTYADPTQDPRLHR